MKKDNDALIDIYLEELKENQKAILEFYRVAVLEDARAMSVQEITTIRRFIKLYGKFRVFYAMIDISTMSIDTSKDCIGILRWALNRMIREEMSVEKSEIDLSKIIKNNRPKNLKIRSID